MFAAASNASRSHTALAPEPAHHGRHTERLLSQPTQNLAPWTPVQPAGWKQERWPKGCYTLQLEVYGPGQRYPDFLAWYIAGRRYRIIDNQDVCECLGISTVTASVLALWNAAVGDWEYALSTQQRYISDTPVVIATKQRALRGDFSEDELGFARYYQLQSIYFLVLLPSDYNGADSQDTRYFALQEPIDFGRYCLADCKRLCRSLGFSLEEATLAALWDPSAEQWKYHSTTEELWTDNSFVLVTTEACALQTPPHPYFHTALRDLKYNFGPDDTIDPPLSPFKPSSWDWAPSSRTVDLAGNSDLGHLTQSPVDGAPQHDHDQLASNATASTSSRHRDNLFGRRQWPSDYRVSDVAQYFKEAAGMVGRKGQKRKRVDLWRAQEAWRDDVEGSDFPHGQEGKYRQFFQKLGKPRIDSFLASHTEPTVENLRSEFLGVWNELRNGRP